MKIRTRFAPSPTGYMHIGNLRTALYAFLISKSKGGDFILRIEDTDRERYIEGATDIIYSTLKETGLLWDEGPDIGGNYGPYIQSERTDIYGRYADELIKKDGAYYCFCNKSRLDELREKQLEQKLTPRYDGHCRGLSADEISKNIAAGIPFVIRQKMPSQGTTSFNDAVFGEITVENEGLDDGVLIKSDKMPTYNFANVVDDHLMGITHVVRGSEYLSSTPKYNLLYKAFGWDIPVYIHCSPVMKDRTRKLSKRDGDASYEDFIKKGYLKEAIINYIALLGWSPQSEREKYNLSELMDVFDIKGISKSPAIFDEEKLAWLSGEYIRELSEQSFYEKALPYLNAAIKSETADLRLLSALLQKRCVRLSDIPSQVDFIDTMPDYDTELYIHKKMKTDGQVAKTALIGILSVLKNCNEWTYDTLHSEIAQVVSELGLKNGQVLYPLRIALSGKAVTPGGGTELAVVLGKEQTINRIEKAIEKLSR
ncbi:MAG: glutamate--tRNA ligase [Firmicutes bacterium]|nr:glutamate--tRNA ligase [Bacillota bacterium]